MKPVLRLSVLVFAATFLARPGFAIPPPASDSSIPERRASEFAGKCSATPKAGSPCYALIWEPYIPKTGPSNEVKVAIGKLSGFVGSWNGTVEDETIDGDRFLWKPYRSFKIINHSVVARNFEGGSSDDYLSMEYDENKRKYKIFLSEYWFGKLSNAAPIYGDLSEDGSLSWTALHKRGASVDRIRTTIRIVDGRWHETEQSIWAGKPARFIQDITLSRTDQPPAP